MSPATSAFFLALFGMKCRGTAVLPGSCIATTYPKSETSKHTYIFRLRRNVPQAGTRKLRITNTKQTSNHSFGCYRAQQAQPKLCVPEVVPHTSHKDHAASVTDTKRSLLVIIIIVIITIIRIIILIIDITTIITVIFKTPSNPAPAYNADFVNGLRPPAAPTILRGTHGVVGRVPVVVVPGLGFGVLLSGLAGKRRL